MSDCACSEEARAKITQAKASRATAWEVTERLRRALELIEASSAEGSAADFISGQALMGRCFCQFHVAGDSVGRIPPKCDHKEGPHSP